MERVLLPVKAPAFFDNMPNIATCQNALHGPYVVNKPPCHVDLTSTKILHVGNEKSEHHFQTCN